MRKILLLSALLISTFVMAQTTWTGAASTDWTNNANWSPDSPGDEFYDEVITIPSSLSTYPVLADDLLLTANISISSGATLTITGGSIRFLSGATIVNNGQVILNSGSAIKLSTSVTGSGNFKYNRNLPVANVFYAMGSPVALQDIDAFIAAEPIPQSSTNNNMGIGTYNTSTDDYTYIQSGASISGSFTPGKGYLVRVNATGDVSFTGSNPTVADITEGLIYTDNRYNLLSNPYPAHLKSGSDGFLGSNSSRVDGTVWTWNAANSEYDTNVLADGIIIAPAQGFYVRAKSSGSGNFTFKNSFLRAENTDNFKNTVEDRFEVHLNISDESINRLAKVYYIAETTTGYDDGYDGELFTSQNNDFTIYTSSESDENSSGLDLAIQSIPEMTHIVPVGVNALEGTEFTISATTLNRPEGYNVYLEDRDNNTFTLLDETSDFITTTSSDLNGTGRFYLHTTASTMSNEQASTNLLSVFKLDRNNFITIQGLSGQSSVTNVKLYSILGSEVLSTTLDNNTNSQSISTQHLSAGIYVVKLESANNLQTKKLIIK